MGSKQQTATATNTSEPWSEQKPYLTQGFQQAQNLYNSATPQYYPNSTVADFTAPQQAAQNLGLSRAWSGNAAQQGANTYATNVLNGAFDNNPNNDAVFNSVQNQVIPAVNTEFAQAGRYGSDSHASTMAKAMTDAYAPIASQNWNAAQDRKMQMAQFAPTLAQADYNDYNAMYDIGSQQQQLAQAQIQDAQNRFNFYQDQPYNKLNQFMGLVGGNWGGTTTSAQPYYTPGIGSQLLGGTMGILGALL